MFKQMWKQWTIDKPAAFGEALWEVLVVQLAAWLDRLTVRKIVAMIPVVVLVLAYTHRIPIPPELMLVGDVIAYIDISSVILLLGVLGRVTAFWIFTRQAMKHAFQLAGRVRAGMPHFDSCRGSEGKMRRRKRLSGRTRFDDDYPVVGSLVWA